MTWSSGDCTISATTGGVASTTSTAAVTVESGASVGTLTNSQSISNSGGDAIANAGAIASISNASTISSTSTTGSGINNSGTITGIMNQNGATISGSSVGVTNGSAATIGTLENAGALAGNVAIYNAGIIGQIDNPGVISGASYAIDNTSTGSLGPINNSGVIMGNIKNESASDLVLNGASGKQNGDFIGQNGQLGTITNPNSNVVLGSGNIYLGDNVDVSGHALNNTGAKLVVGQNVAITGNYSQAAGATLQVNVSPGAVANGNRASDSGYGRLVVSGSATIAPGSSVALQPLSTAFGSIALVAGQRFVVVDASSQGTQYNEKTLNYSAAGFNGAVSGQAVTADGRSDLLVTLGTTSTSTPGDGTGTGTGTGTGSGTVTPPNTGSLATQPNAGASLDGLTSYTGYENQNLLNLYNAALALGSTGSTSEINRAGVQLSPALQSSSAQAAAAPTFDSLNIVAAHSNSVRIAQADGAQSGIATGEASPKWGAWGQAFGGHAGQGVIDGVDGYSANYGGFLIGADRAINDRWRAGGVFTYSNTLVDGTENAAGSSTRVNAYGLLGYASYAGSPWYVDMSAGVIQQNFDSTRVVDFQGFSGVANGSYSGQQYVMNAEFGWPLALGKATLTPIARLDYSYQHQGSYTESGGNGAALAVDATHETSVRSTLGGKLERGFSTHYGIVEPSVAIAWTHEYNHSRLVTGARYAGDPLGQTSFTTVGASPVSDLADIGVGVTLLRGNTLTLSARYDLQAGSHFTSQTGSLRIRELF
ncbi:hypothetical protein A9R05_43510 (plasmid) [Burkholderia sp. KK1]|nr:hypothetical protein A9R05_43510 [Burkholderia sp. KK1]